MIRQYGAQRSMGGPNPLRVGIIPVGAIFYLQDDGWWRERHRPKPICREPWIVDGFFNGVMGAARRNRETGHWESVYLAGRSDVALVRSAGNREQQQASRTGLAGLAQEWAASGCPSALPESGHGLLLERG